MVEHELALLGISGIHPGNEVNDVVEGDATSGCAILNGSGCGYDTLRLAIAAADGEVLVHTASEGVGQELAEEAVEVESAVLQEFEGHRDDRGAVSECLERHAAEGRSALGALVILRNDGRLGSGVVDGREREVATPAGGDDLPSFEHATVGLEGDFDAGGKIGRDEHTCGEASDAVALLDEGTALRREGVQATDEVFPKGPAVFRILLGGGSTSGCATVLALIDILGLTPLDVEESLLGSDCLISLVIVSKEGVPPLLLFCGHLTTVSFLAESVNLGIQPGTLLFEFFEFL